jgi:hypothetical protein
VIRRSGDRVFYTSTGAFALVLVLIVGAIAVVLFRESELSIRAFGLRFWETSTWDPVAGNFGRSRSSGARYIPRSSRCCSRRRSRSASRSSSRSSVRVAPDAAHVPHGAARGDPVHRLRPVGHLRAGAPHP